MIQYYNNGCYLSSNLDEPLKLFFRSAFEGFHEELNLLADVIYKEKTQKLFFYIERTWVGVFNNAVKSKIPDAATLEEFSVALENGNGRADYFVRLPEQKIDLLFEAKMYEDQGSQNHDGFDGMKWWYCDIINQTQKYYNPEKTEYLNDTYLVALIFGWMRKGNAIQTAKDYMDLPDAEKALKDPCDFCALYHTDDHGVWVYGKVEKIKTFELP